MAYKNKTIHFKFLKPINILLIVITSFAVLITGAIALIFLMQNRFNEVDNSILVDILINAFAIVLPIVLFILCIISSIDFTGELAKKNIYVNNLSRFELLSKINILCLEKTNVITDGSLEIKKVVPLHVGATEQYLGQWVSNLLRATNNEGSVFETLKQKYGFELSAGIVSALSYNENIKYSGATFKGGKTIVLGDPQFVPIKNRIGILKRCEEYINNGCKVLVVGEGREQISEVGYPSELDVIALIVLKDHIRDDAFETFKWFKKNGTSIKVVSSDNPLSVSVLAAEAGIENANRYISLEGMDNEEIMRIINEYTVFGNANKEQKEFLLNAYKLDKQITAMIGNDDNDINAMKKANFSIAVNNSNDEVKKAADLVLANNSLKSLAETIDESDLYINNLSKVVSLSIAKSLFVIVALVAYVFISLSSKDTFIALPFMFNHFILWDLLINGVASFFLLSKKNREKMQDSFINNVFKKALPILLLQLFGVATVFILFMMQEDQLINLGIDSVEAVVAMNVIIITAFSGVALYDICAPLNKYRKIVVISTLSFAALALFIGGLVTYLSKKTGLILQIPFLAMSGPTYLATAIVIVVLASIYLFISQIIRILKGDVIEDED